MKPDPVARQFRAHRERYHGLRQIPEIEDLYPAGLRKLSRDQLTAALPGLPGAWAAKIRPLLRADAKIKANDAKVFMSSWGNLAWNARKASEKALETLRSSTRSLFGPIGNDAGQIVDNFAVGWETELREERDRWNKRDPAYRALLAYLGSAGDRLLTEDEKFECARQASSLAGLAQQSAAFMEQTQTTIKALAGSVKVVDFSAVGDALAAGVKFVVDAAMQIVDPVLDAAGGVVRRVGASVFGAIPWWLWVGAAGVAYVVVFLPGRLERSASAVIRSRQAVGRARDAVS